MIKLKTSEPTTLNFTLDIEGSGAEPKINYVIESTPFNYSFDAKLENGVVIVDIPLMEHVISPGQYNAKIEVILEDSYFQPWSGSIEVETPVKVEIKETVIEETPKEKISVKLVEETVKSIKTENPKSQNSKGIKKKYIKKPVSDLMEDLINV